MWVDVISSRKHIGSCHLSGETLCSQEKMKSAMHVKEASLHEGTHRNTTL